MNRFSLRFLFVVVAIVAIACWMIRSFYPFGSLYALLFVTACGGGMAVVKHRGALAALIGLALLIIGGLGFDMLNKSGHPVPIDPLQRIQPGTTKAEVNALLGTPTRIRCHGYDWIYSGSTWCRVTVHSTTDGKVGLAIHST